MTIFELLNVFKIGRLLAGHVSVGDLFSRTHKGDLNITYTSSFPQAGYVGLVLHSTAVTTAGWRTSEDTVRVL